jgi:hypothetical protein
MASDVLEPEMVDLVGHPLSATDESFLEILVIVRWDTCERQDVIRRGVERATETNARLTLAQAIDPGWIARWFAPAAMAHFGGVTDCVAPYGVVVERVLADLGTGIPNDISLRAVLLGENTAKSVQRMLTSHQFDIVIVGLQTLVADRKLRRALDRTDASVEAV